MFDHRHVGWDEGYEGADRCERGDNGLLAEFQRRGKLRGQLGRGEKKWLRKERLTKEWKEKVLKNSS